MNKHEEKYCPRFGASFTCKTGDIANCQCTSIRLGEDTIKFLAQTPFDCLCKDCLSKINHDIRVSKAYKFPTQKEMFIEGLHYYKEGGYWVFTELYHILRGHCCKSGCRHCVYGFSKTENASL